MNSNKLLKQRMKLSVNQKVQNISSIGIVNELSELESLMVAAEMERMSSHIMDLNHLDK